MTVATVTRNKRFLNHVELRRIRIYEGCEFYRENAFSSSEVKPHFMTIYVTPPE